MRKTIYLQFTILNTLIKCTCHLNSKHARNLKFGMHTPCVAFHRFGEAILEILLFGRFMAKKLPKNPIWSAYFGTFLIKSQPKSEILKSVTPNILNVTQGAFQISSPQHLCCLNEFTFFEFLVLRFEDFVRTVFTGKSGFSKSHNSGQE